MYDRLSEIRSEHEHVCPGRFVFIESVHCFQSCFIQKEGEFHVMSHLRV